LGEAFYRLLGEIFLKFREFLVGPIKEVFCLTKSRQNVRSTKAAHFFIYNNFYILGAGGRGF